MNYDYDKKTKQYRRRREEGECKSGEVVNSGGNIYQTASAAENRRPKSYHKPWHHSRKKWKAAFWVIFTLGVLFWIGFMVFVVGPTGIGGGEGNGQERPQSNPMRDAIDRLAP